MALNGLIILLLTMAPVSTRADGNIPTYLFEDWRYWLFIVLYALITVKLVQWWRWLADKRDRSRPFPIRDVSWAAAFVLFNGLLYQALHHYEHVSQIFQYWYLGEDRTTAKGIVFFLDLEWNHFLFDSGYFVLLLAASVLFIKRWKERGHEFDSITTLLIACTIGIQGWHTVEHSYRVLRHVRTGCEPCAGISDIVFHVGLIPLHFWFNVLALTLPLLLFFWLRMDRLLVAFFQELGARLRLFLARPRL